MATNAYEIVTDRITSILAEGTVPWRKPWKVEINGPRNLEGRFYRGINVLILLASGYESPIWMTFNQAREHGGCVKKGEKATPVILWKTDAVKVEDPETGETKLRKRFFLRYFSVFNLSQTEGVKVPAKTLAGLTELQTVDPIESAESIIADMPSAPPIFWDSRRAYYRPSRDEVHVPSRDSFESPEAVYATLFHELGHSTGHESRLKRPGITDLHSFGDEMYSREELVAEMTSAFLCGETGIAPKTLDNTAAYIANWIGALKQDPKALVVAAGQAQRAADYILGRVAASVEPISDAEVKVEAVAA